VNVKNSTNQAPLRYLYTSVEQYGKVFGLPELVVRLYEQTQDAATKTRCLNSIDAMLELGFGSLESELQKIER
jgi:hypothetical protein